MTRTQLETVLFAGTYEAALVAIRYEMKKSGRHLVAKATADSSRLSGSQPAESCRHLGE